MSTATLHYIYDPLCGWCYGSAPLVKAAREIGGLRMPGIMTIALGVGLALSGVFLADVDAGTLHERFANGAILVCLGIGLLVVGQLDRPDRRA